MTGRNGERVDQVDQRDVDRELADQVDRAHVAAAWHDARRTSGARGVLARLISQTT